MTTAMYKVDIVQNLGTLLHENNRIQITHNLKV